MSIEVPVLSSPLRVLVLYRAYTPLDRMRLAVRSHLRFPDAWSRDCQIVYFNAALGAPAWLKYLRSHIIILHTTFLGTRWLRHFPQWKRTLRWLTTEPALKVAFPQDEYDHAHVLDTWLAEMGVSLVFSIFGDPQRRQLYPTLHATAEFHQCLTGYLDETGTCDNGSPLAERRTDIVYRATRLPFWFGSHGQLKHEIAEATAREAPSLGLACDISTDPRSSVVGSQWFNFLRSGKAVIGCEGGSSVLDATGEVQRAVEVLRRRRPSASFAEVSQELPPEWDDHRFYALSPRHLEAVASRTAQFLVEGEYNGVLKPYRHYLPIKRDFSNLRDVLGQLRKPETLQPMVDTAFAEITRSGLCSRERFAQCVFSICVDQLGARPGARPTPTKPRVISLVGAAARWESRALSALLGVLVRGRRHAWPLPQRRD